MRQLGKNVVLPASVILRKYKSGKAQRSQQQLNGDIWTCSSSHSLHPPYDISQMMKFRYSWSKQPTLCCGNWNFSSSLRGSFAKPGSKILSGLELLSLIVLRLKWPQLRPYLLARVYTRVNTLLAEDGLKASYESWAPVLIHTSNWQHEAGKSKQF